MVLVDHLQKTKKECKNLKKQEIHNIYQKELDEACFKHDMAYWDFKDLTRKTASDKILLDKGLNIAKNSKYDGYQRGLASMVYQFFDKNASCGAKLLASEFAFGRGIKNENISNKDLTEELLKAVIRKMNKRKVYSSFIDNIWGADLADMQLISKFYEGIHFLLCVIDIFSRYAWVIPLKDKKGITITNGSQKMLKKINLKPNKKWIDKGSKF